jgi:hypothetical protein
MSPAEKRVEVAKDVINQIKAGRYTAEYTAETDSYVLLNDELFDLSVLRGDEGRAKQQEAKEQQVCDLLSGEDCTVCARGALFISCVRRFDNLSVGELKPDESNTIGAMEFAKYEKLFFTDKQVTLIESAFEGTYLSKGRTSLSDEEKAACRGFHDKYKHEDDRLIAICKSIIKNDGEFVIPEKFWSKDKDEVEQQLDRMR